MENEKQPNPVGRPSVMTPEVLKKLEEAFAMGCTDNEACLYADITPKTLYNYQNAHPEFLQRKEVLKDNPVLLARQTVIANLHEPDHAEWFLERKKKDEFSTRVESTGKDGNPIVFVPSELMNKYGINPSTSDNSQGHPQVPGSELRTEVRQDDTSRGGDEGGSSVEAEQNKLHSPDLPTGEGYSLERTGEVVQTDNNENQREQAGTGN